MEDEVAHPLAGPSSRVDHSYSCAPSVKRRKTDGIEDAYIETLNVLKDIREVLDVRLSEIKDEIKSLKETIREQ